MIPTDPFSILLVDDDSGLRFLLRRFLLAQKYQVYEAGDGTIGLRQFERIQPDLVLLDICMPRMDGITLLQAIRRQNQTIGILMISANRPKQLGVNLLEIGADGYVPKPFQLPEIAPELQRLETLVMLRRAHENTND